MPNAECQNQKHKILSEKCLRCWINVMIYYSGNKIYADSTGRISIASNL